VVRVVLVVERRDKAARALKKVMGRARVLREMGRADLVAVLVRA
jgi:ribosomal protein S21